MSGLNMRSLDQRGYAGGFLGLLLSTTLLSAPGHAIPLGTVLDHGSASQPFALAQANPNAASAPAIAASPIPGVPDIPTKIPPQAQPSVEVVVLPASPAADAKPGVPAAGQPATASQTSVALPVPSMAPIPSMAPVPSMANVPMNRPAMVQPSANAVVSPAVPAAAAPANAQSASGQTAAAPLVPSIPSLPAKTPPVAQSAIQFATPPAVAVPANAPVKTQSAPSQAAAAQPVPGIPNVPTKMPPLAQPTVEVAMPPAATAAATMSPVTIPVAAAAADAHDDSKSDPSVGPSAGKSDEDRAKDVLNSESKQSVVVPHALQLAAPDFNIVVCEAGCGDSRARVVYKQAKALMRSVANDPKLAYAPVTKNAECKGGCANDGGTRRVSAAEPAPKLLSPEAGNWLTKVAPSANASSPPASPVAAPTSEAPKPQAIAPQAIAPQSNTPQASTGAREDWLARINRERAEAKGQAPAIDAKAAPKS